MRRVFAAISIGSLIICSILAAIVFVPANQIVPFWYGSRYDGIELKQIETGWILKKYEITGFPREARDWITLGHDGAYGQQIFYSFVDWGLSNPEGFIEITEGIEPSKRERLVYMLATGVIDNLDEDEFAAVFGHSDALIINEVKEAIRQQKLR